VLEAESALAAARQTSTAAIEVERVVGEKFQNQAALEVDVTEARAQKANAEAALLSAEDAVLSQKEQLNLVMGRDVRTAYRVVSVPEPSPVSIDVAAARAKALGQQPAARQARLTASQADLNWRKKRSEYIPDLSFSASYLSPFSIRFLPKNIFTVGLLLDWEIFDGGRRAREAAEARELAEQARLAAADRDASIEVDVAKKHRSLEESRRKLAAADLLRAAKRDRLRISGERYGQQAIRAEDLLRAQADLADAEKQYVAALAGYWSARADYDRAVGEDPS
jgi:outer membrane protein